MRGIDFRSPLIAVALVFALGSSLCAAQEEDPFADVSIESEELAEGVHMLTGAGGNIGASIGEDGALIVDDQFEPLADRIRAALSDLGAEERPQFILNTHFHGDHTGGNAEFGRDGVIFAHENVRIRLDEDEEVEPEALPVVTYEDRIRLWVNGNRIDVVHLPHGHTDGDSVVWFREANVVHVGDLLFNGMFPFVDVDNGGTVHGMIRNVAGLIERLPDDVQIIPGHGPAADMADLRRFHEMLTATHEHVREALARGDSLESMVADGLPQEWSEWESDLIDAERWIRINHASLTRMRGTDHGRHGHRHH